MKHLTLPRFWRHYRQLPREVQELADKSFELLKADPYHPSLHFKKIGGTRQLWSVRVGAHYRALGADKPEGTVWFWIGTHAEYDKLLSLALDSFLTFPASSCSPASLATWRAFEVPWGHLLYPLQKSSLRGEPACGRIFPFKTVEDLQSLGEEQETKKAKTGCACNAPNPELALCAYPLIMV